MTWIYPYFIRSFGSRSYWPLPVRIIYRGIFAFITSFSILLSAVILVNLLRLLPYTRGVWQRIRADWTQLSFMFYGGLVFGILLTFEGYRYEDIWKYMAWTGLALGAWGHLRVKGQTQRILALIGGATGAMWIAALAKCVLIPLQDWQSRYSVIPMETLRWVETSGAIIGWVWILTMLIAPTLLNVLPRAPSPIVSKEKNPVTV